MGEERRDFFISYTSADQTWAEWIAWQLEAAGYTTLIQAWDFRPGADWAIKMQDGTTEWSRILAVLSPHFFESKFTSAEWTSAFAKDPTGELGLLIPVRVAECEPPGLLRARIYVDLVGLGEDAARKKLLDGVKQERAKPTEGPLFPGSVKPKPAFPPAVPSVIHNLPFPPNPLFTGRDREQERLQAQLQRQGEVAVTQVVAVHGLGGVGKTQLAVEYAWKHLRDYAAVFWVKADGPEALDASLAALSAFLGLPEAKEREQALQTKAVLDWLSEHERWLLIADGVDDELAVKSLREGLPPNFPGDVLITSRLSRWPLSTPNLLLDSLRGDDAALFLLNRVAKEGHDAGDEAAAKSLAHELGNLPLALEQAAALIVEVKWTFARYQATFREARPKLLDYQAEGGTHYPASVAKTWLITLERLSPLARALLRLVAWFAPDGIPRGLFSAKKEVLAEAVGDQRAVSGLSIDQALGELGRFALIRLATETVSVHRLLQAVEQDSLSGEERQRWLVWAARISKAFVPDSPDDVRTWGDWLPLQTHLESLLDHAEHYGVESPEIARLANPLGVLLYARGRYPRAEVLLRRALEMDQKIYGPDHRYIAIYLNNLARVLHLTNQLKEAEALYRRAVDIDAKSYGPDHPEIANRLNNLAQLLQETNRLEEAQEFYRRVLEINQKIYGPDHPEVGAALNNLAVLLHSTNRLPEAELLFRRVLEIDQKSYGPNHPRVAAVLNNLAQLLHDANRLEEAEPLMRRTLAIDIESYGPDHPDIARDLNNLARLLQATNRLEEAEPLYRRALEIVEKSYGPGHPKVARASNNLAGLLRATNRMPQAEPLYRRALEIHEKSYGPDHPDVAASLNSLARLLEADDRLEEAEPLSARNVVILLKTTRLAGHLHPRLKTSLLHRRRLLRKMGVNDREIVEDARALGMMAGCDDDELLKLEARLRACT